MSIKKALVLLVILIGGCFLYSCNVSGNNRNLEDDKKESINVKDSTTSIDMVQENRLNIDSING